MKIIETKYIDWSNDPDRGEFHIGQGLINHQNLLSDDFIYVHIALCFLINGRGIPFTQNVIDEITDKQNKRMIFVCQHVYLNNLKFYGNLVFSTHATINDKNIISIPHYSAVYDKSKIKEERDMLFCFVGHDGTHPIRKYFVNKYPDSCISTEGQWMSEKYRNKYIEFLGRSKFSLCVRGTGPSSFRIYESLAMKTIPVIISDSLKLPLANMFNWSSFSIKIKEDNIDNLENILLKYSDNQIKEMFENGQKFWDEYCSDENLYKTIIEQLKN